MVARGLLGGRQLLHPFEIAMGPGPYEPDEQDRCEQDQLGQSNPAVALLGPFGVHDHHGEGERDVDLEDDEGQRDQVEARVEVVPSGAHGPFAAFIDGNLVRIGEARPDDGADQQGHQGEEHGDDREGEHCAELEAHEFLFG
jgi:hypothetical protein